MKGKLAHERGVESSDSSIKFGSRKMDVRNIRASMRPKKRQYILAV